MKQASPEIDRLAGIDYYSTQFEGVGGQIKKNYNDFHVTEIIEESFLEQLTEYPNSTNIFPIFRIEKKGMDSNHAIMELKNRLGLHLKIVGIKDAKATTIQYASGSGGMSRNMNYQSGKNKRNIAIKNYTKLYDKNNTIHNQTKYENTIRTKNILLKCMGFSRKPIEKDYLIGNRFNIRILDIKKNKINNISKFLLEIENIGNYYGLQRFGSERLVTHLVGKAILSRNFKNAIETLLTYTTKFDSKYSIEIRKKLKDVKNQPNLIEQIPKGMDIEKKIAIAIVKGRDPISAIRTIPIGVRRLFIQAVQAFLFNRVLSRAIFNEFSLRVPEKNDLCFEIIEDNLKLGKLRKFDENSNRKNNKVTMIPVIRLPGYSFQPGKGRFDNLLKEIMEEENINSKEFFIKELQELSESGGFRQPAYICKDFQYNLEDKYNSLIVNFSIPKGSYATVLLRELIKPSNPIDSGF